MASTANATTGQTGRIHARDERQAGREHDHAGDGREPGLEQDRREHHGGVVDACAARRDDARGGRPDAAGDVLREHREHLRAQHRAVAEADAVGAQDALPAQHEEQVVGRQQDVREQDELEVGVAQARPGVAHGIAELVAEEGEQDDGGRDLDAGQQARAARAAPRRGLSAGSAGSRAHTSPAPPGPVLVPTTAPSGATSSITACGRALRTVSAMSFAIVSAWACATPTRSRSSARVSSQTSRSSSARRRAWPRTRPSGSTSPSTSVSSGRTPSRPPTSACPRPMRPLRWRNSSVSNANTSRERRWNVSASGTRSASAQGPASSCRAMPSPARASADRHRAGVDDRDAALELGGGQARRADRRRERLREVQREHVLVAVLLQQRAVGGREALGRRRGGVRRQRIAREALVEALRADLLVVEQLLVAEAHRQRHHAHVGVAVAAVGQVGGRVEHDRAPLGGQRLGGHSALTE